MKIVERTSPQINALPRDMVVLFPVGSLEQHSLHLPVFTDTMIVDEVVRRVETQIPNDVLLLPTMWLGYSMHHIHYPGTISASSETHVNLMFDTVASLIRHDFKKVLIVNSHGGNEANIAVLLQRIMEAYEDTEVFATTPYSGPADKRMLEGVLELGNEGSGHAGETETAMMMAIHPDLVGKDQREDGRQGRLRLPGARTYRRFDKRTHHGGMGDPRPATAEKGDKLLQIAAEFLIDVALRIRAGNYYDPA